MLNMILSTKLGYGFPKQEVPSIFYKCNEEGINAVGHQHLVVLPPAVI
jgi:hypothetical protein